VIYQEASIWIIYGTFSCAPQGFLQLLTVHFFGFGQSFPAFNVFMKKKKIETYKGFLNLLKPILNSKQELSSPILKLD
jgi:hypothetical protein